MALDTNFQAFLVGLLSFCLMPAIGNAASFDCAKAASVFEKTVCADAEISSLDETLARSYASAVQALSEDGKQILREGQKRWLHFAYNVCFKYSKDKEQSACVRRMYERRIKDMKTAAIQIGPFLFSRIDYYYAKGDEEFGRPYEGQTSYPRIDNPSYDALKKWNAIIAPSSKAEGEDWCDGSPGDVDVDFVVESATETTISLQKSHWMYCHGAAHGIGGTNGVTYILRPVPHLMQETDLFSPNTPWQNFLADRCYEAVKSKAKEVNVDKNTVERIVIHSRAWALTNEGLTITINPYEVLAYAYGETVVTIPWKDLRPFLISTASIPH